MVTAYSTDDRFDAHTMPGHPEHAGRLQAIRQRIAADGLLSRLHRVNAQPVSEETLALVHTPHYLAQLRATRALRAARMIEPDTYVTPQSYDLAMLAVGAVVQVVDAVMRGDAANGLAAVRPPGHHATPDRAMGFCLLNNVAVAARHAQQVHGVTLVAIVDYDVHHGNGTQDAYYGDGTVLYVSTHQAPLYPGTGGLAEVGEGAGTGFNVNIPLRPGTGDNGYRQVVEEAVSPLLLRFGPELILVSVGFDAHWVDPLAHMGLSLRGYDALARALILGAEQTCEGRIVFVLEGGYALDPLSHGWANVARALLGDPAGPDLLGGYRQPEAPVADILQQVKHLHKLK